MNTAILLRNRPTVCGYKVLQLEVNKHDVILPGEKNVEEECIQKRKVDKTFFFI